MSSGSGVVLQPALLNGTQLSLQWAAVGGVPVAEYIIEAGSGPCLSNLYNGSVGLSTSISASVGPGVYYVRVRARTGAATSVVSNEISFSTNFDGVSAGPGCTAAPSRPARRHGGGRRIDRQRVVVAVAWRDLIRRGGGFGAWALGHLLRRRRPVGVGQRQRVAGIHGLRSRDCRELVRTERRLGRGVHAVGVEHSSARASDARRVIDRNGRPRGRPFAFQKAGS